MQKGRGGMGSHKHGISGHAPNNPSVMQRIAREMNEKPRTQKRVRRRRMLDAKNIHDLFNG